MDWLAKPHDDVEKLRRGLENHYVRRIKDCRPENRARIQRLFQTHGFNPVGSEYIKLNRFLLQQGREPLCSLDEIFPWLVSRYGTSDPEHLR
jgi:hypothetical protein